MIELSFEAELGQRRGDFAAVLRGFALAVLADGDRSLHDGLYRAGLTRLDLDAEFHGAGAAAREFVGGAHHASERGVGAVQLESDRLVRVFQAPILGALEEFAPQDPAVVAEAIGEMAIAGVEPDAGEVLVAEARR